MAFDLTLISLYILNFCINAANSILAPFYPDLATEKGISKGLIGVVFSAHPICSFFFSMILGKMMNLWGRKRIMFISLIFQAIGLILFGVVIHMENYALFLSISLLARAIQGIGLSGYSSIAFAYLPMLYPDSVGKKIAYMELLTGLGLMLGPLIGGALFELGGYQCPFYVLSGVFILVAPFLMKKLPNDKIHSEEAKKETLQLRKFFTNRQFFIFFVILILPNCGISFLEPTLANHLHDFTSSSFLIAVIFSVGTLTYVFTIFIISLFPKEYNRKTVIIIGTIFCAISYLLLGPEPNLGFPSEIWIVITGLCIMGVGCALTLVPSIPEFIEIGDKIYPNHKEAVGDMASGMFGSAYSAGILIGPLVGGALDQSLGFPKAESIYSLVTLIILGIYIIAGKGYLGFKNSRNRIEEKIALINQDENFENIDNKETLKETIDGTKLEQNPI